MGIERVTGRAVFLDRDGVLNRVVIDDAGVSHPPADLDAVELLPGASEACADLRGLGFYLIVVTNQPDVARGTQRREVVEEINAHIRRALGLDDVRTCYHDDRDSCDCRKPAPGLILEAARDWDIDPGRSYLIGDRGSDIEAGARAGCVTVLVQNGAMPAMARPPDHSTRTLRDAARWIGSRERTPAKGG